MKKQLLIICILLINSSIVFSQGKYFTRTGKINFFSETPMENIDAENNQVSSILDTESGDLVLSAQMVGFEFEKALMQEHFNENYVESEKFPKATFKGQIIDFDLTMLSDGNEKEVIVEGELSIHGVSNKISTKGTIQKTDDKIAAQAEFMVKVKDYDIKIPKAVVENIAESILVTVNVNLEPYNK